MATVKPIKVMRIIARLNVGGPAVHCETLSSGLVRHGFQTTLVAGSTEQGEASYEELFLKETDSYRLIKLPKMKRSLNFAGDLFSFWRLCKIMRREKPQIVHTHTAKAGFLGRLAALVSGVPVVVHTYHGHVLSGYFSATFSSFITFLERLLALKTTALVTLSPQLKNILSKEFRVAPPSKFHIVPLGRDLSAFQAMPRRCGKLRSELGLSEDCTVFGIIGRLVPIKAHVLLFDALERLKSKADWKLLVIGEGPLAEELKSKVEASSTLRSRVFFLGWRRDLPEIYSDLDFSVLCSLNEGTPLSIIEAFAGGCPVISTDVGGVRDMLTFQGKTEKILRYSEGLVVPPQDAESLSKAIDLMLDEPGLRQMCSVAGRQRAMAYTEEALTTRVAQLYAELLQRPLLT